MKRILSPVLIWICCTSAMQRRLKTWPQRQHTGPSCMTIQVSPQTWMFPGLRRPTDSRVMWVSQLSRNKNVFVSKGKSSCHFRPSPCLYVETIQVRSELDEGRRLGGFRFPGRPAGKEGRRAHQRGGTSPKMHCTHELRAYHIDIDTNNSRILSLGSTKK